MKERPVADAVLAGRRASIVTTRIPTARRLTGRWEMSVVSSR